MSKTYITITGTRFYQGHDFLKPGMEVLLAKEPDNEFDSEAIMVKMPGVGQLGHVANSVHTVLGESISAGRLYDKIGKKARAKVAFKLPGGVICQVNKKDLK